MTEEQEKEICAAAVEGEAPHCASDVVSEEASDEDLAAVSGGWRYFPSSDMMPFDRRDIIAARTSQAD